MNFTVTSCVHPLMCALISSVFETVNATISTHFDVRANINFTYVPIKSDYPDEFGHGRPAHYFSFSSDMFRPGFDYPQALIKHLHRQDTKNQSVLTYAATHFHPYDIDVVLNSENEMKYYYGNGTIQDYQVDLGYLLTRFVLNGLGIHTAYGNHGPEMLTTKPKDQYYEYQNDVRIQKIGSFSLPTIFDQFLYVKVQRLFLWQNYKKSLQLRLEQLQPHWWESLYSRNLGFEVCRAAYQYVLRPNNLIFLLDTDQYNGLTINDELVNGKLVLDLLNRSYCDTSEFILCIDYLFGREFKNMYEGILVGPKVVKMLKMLGY